MHEGTGSLVALQGIAKQFGAVHALAGVDLVIEPGETLGIVGHNGAGKTTLMFVLNGTIQPSSGVMRVDGAEVGAGYDVRRAQELGIRCVFQELSLSPNLRVFENVRLLHRSLTGLGWPRRARKVVRETLDAIFPGHGIDADALVGELPAAQRQMVEIARAFSVTDLPVRLVILDEPTSSLGGQEAEQLMRYMHAVTKTGVSCVFISHRLKEVLANVDRVVVMRDGAVVARQRASELSEGQLVERMGVMAQAAERTRAASRAARLEPVAGNGTQSADVRVDLRPSPRSPKRLVVHAGEVVGLAGLDGHGQRAALLEAFAAARGGGGEAARVHGTVAYVSGDRQGEGLFPLWSVGRNLTIGSMARLAKRGGWLSREGEAAEARHWRDHLAIRTPDVDQPILSLSGGNQQKVLIARGLAGGADILLLDDPMRGVDVGTKREMFEEIRAEAGQGKCFLLYTTETAELQNCDRVYVFYRGAITEEIDRASLTEDRVLRASFGEAGAHV
jgi:ribose transport system ATP-binding protein